MCATNIYMFLTCLVVLVIHQTNCIKVDMRHKPLYNISSDTFQGYDVTEIQTLLLDTCSINIINGNSFVNMTKLESLNIARNNFKHIPDTLFNQTINLELLLLSENKIEHLSKDIFSKLKRLRTLDLGSNNIRELDPSLFENNERLTWLAINSNNIEVLPRNIFAKSTSLKTLWLYNNSISAIDPTTFAHTTQIVKISIWANKLTELKNGTFTNLPKLEYLDLANNEISHIETNVFPVTTALKQVQLNMNKLQNIAPEIILNLKGIKYIGLDDNPWNCDRRFKPLLTTLHKLKSTPDFDIPACAAPAALADRDWDKLQDADFTAVDITPNVTTHYVKERDSVLFSCRVTGDHDSNFTNIQWTHERHTLYLNDSNKFVFESNLINGSMLYNLQITDVHQQDGGLYKCVYQDEFGEIEKQIKLEFYETDTNLDLNDGNVSLTMVYESNFHSRISNHVRLPCLLTYQRGTNVFWTFGSKSVSTSDTSASGNYYRIDSSLATNITSWFNLTIFSVNVNDSGTYKCEASNIRNLNNKPVVYKNINVVNLFIDN